MRNLLPRINRYASYSRTPYKGRLIRLIAFGNVMLSQKTRGVTLQKLPDLLSTITYGRISEKIQPGNVFTASINGFTGSQIKYALLQNRAGDAIVDDLLDMPANNGEYGLEAEIVGAMSLTYHTNLDRITQGLNMNILNDCYSYNCTRTSSLAPFKIVGTMLTIAEASVAVGDIERAKDNLLRAKKFASANDMPLEMRKKLITAAKEITGSSFIKASQRLNGIGGYRQPAGPSQDAMACALCHSGAEVPDYYYSWKD